MSFSPWNFLSHQTSKSVITKTHLTAPLSFTRGSKCGSDKCCLGAILSKGSSANYQLSIGVIERVVSESLHIPIQNPKALLS